MRRDLPGFAVSHATRLGGLLGRALDANLRGRLSTFILDETSPAIALFQPQQVAQNEEGDWYGEHAGKWLYAAAKAAHRGGDDTLAARVRRIADYLVGRQDRDGYLGTYAPARRFPVRQVRGPRTWDGAPDQRTWDIWTHSYLVLGLLEVYRHGAEERYLDAARRIGDLCWRTLTEEGIDITDLGNHHGLSATVMLDAAVELYSVTADKKYLDLALLILQQADLRPELALLSRALAGTDAAEIGTGKAYQLCWNFVGIAKLHRATGDARYLQAAQHIWSSIRDYHLTLGGGPWGGVGHRSREVFNHQSVFSPEGYVETCSTLAWIQLNRELLVATGKACYAEEIERSAYNDLLGAQAANGEDWCYYSFANGRRTHTTFWRCCKSSGAMALEELPGIAYRLTANGDIAVNLYGPGRATLATPQAGEVALEQNTDYPFDGRICLRVRPQHQAQFSLLVRIPSWATRASVQVNGVAWGDVGRPGTYLALNRVWSDQDEIVVQFPMHPVLHRKSSRSVQESRAPDGTPVAQEVMRRDYIAVTRGPLVYATGLIDGFKIHETIRLPAGPEHDWLECCDSPPEYDGPGIRLRATGRAPLLFVPYYQAGGRRDGAWRLTWMEVAPETAEAGEGASSG